MSYRDAVYFFSARRMAGVLGGGLTWLYPPSPMSCLEHSPGPRAMTFATFGYARGPLTPEGSEMAPSRLSAAPDVVLPLR